LTDSPDDITAAEKGNFTGELQNVWSSDLWMDPVFFGKYSDDTLERYREFLPQITDSEMKIISQEIDFTGINIYQGFFVSGDRNGSIIRHPERQGFDRTAIHWPVVPECLYWGARLYYERYGKPVVIGENGMSNTDWIFSDGAVHDVQRIEFLRKYLTSLRKAAAEGIPIDAYFHWSLTDNFEWAYGYNERFGLIHVDYTTQKRTIKDSGYWYKRVIEANGESL
jgi:beta-glucosidase